VGNVILTGRFAGTLDFDPGPGEDLHTSNGYNDVFLCKFDSRGDFAWAVNVGGQDYDCGKSVAVDKNGNAYVTGEFRGSVDFDPGPGEDFHTSKGDRDAFLVKFDQEGSFLWAESWGGLHCEPGLSVAVDDNGNAYVTGDFFSEDDFDFDPGPGKDIHISNGNEDAYLVKYDPDGKFLWAENWGGKRGDIGTSVAVGYGAVYVTGGVLSKSPDFDPGSGEDIHQNNAFEDAYLSKFNLDGNFLWARTWGGLNIVVGMSVAVGNAEDVYVTGYFWEAGDFDPGVGVDLHTSNGDKDVFLSKFDSEGSFLWADTWGGIAEDNGASVSADDFGYVYAAGEFDKTVDFDPGPQEDVHTTNGNGEAFLSRLDPDGNFVWARTWGASRTDSAMSGATDDFGNVYITGSFEKTVDFDPGPGVDNHTSDRLDIFLIKFLPDGNWN
jgi:hypothetical protein